MRIEVLYLAGCPNRGSAVQQVCEALALEKMQGEIHQIEISSHAEAWRVEFPGSPTIRINGQDVAQVSAPVEEAGLMCRLYEGAVLAGVPSLAAVRNALREVARKGAV